MQLSEVVVWVSLLDPAIWRTEEYRKERMQDLRFRCQLEGFFLSQCTSLAGVMLSQGNPMERLPAGILQSLGVLKMKITD
jgi:hypothetical protein